MKAQLTITVNGAKWLIARAIIQLPEVKGAFQNGKIILKGGTTVSCIAEELLGIKLRISGRITKRGTTASFEKVDSPHSVFIKNGKWQNIDENFLDKVLEMGPKDIIIIGANMIDIEGNAAMMAGSPGGGNPGKAIAALTSEGAKVIIAASLEKLIPGKITDILSSAGRKNCDYAMGMAVGLIPIFGQVVTEIVALKIIADVNVTIIGRGGIDGGEGSTTVLIDGTEEALQKAINEVISANSRYVSGDEKSMKECEPGSPGCSYHLSCVYSHKNKIK